MKFLKPISPDATRAFQEKYGKSSPAKQRALQVFHPRKFGAMFEDVVARKQLCEDVVQQVGQGIIVLDRDWKISAANSELEGIFGMQGANATGKGVFEFLFSFLDSEQIGILSSQMESRRGGNKGQYELTINAGGVEKTIMITATPRKDKAGKVTGSIGLIEDITERKKAYERLEMFFRGVHDSPVAIAITDLSGNTIYANGSYVSMAGSPLSELVGKMPPTLMHSPIQQMWSAKDTAGMASGKSGWKGQLTPTGGSCAGSVLETTVSPVIGSDGKAFGFLIIHEDITAIVKMGEELTSKIRDLAQTNDQRDSLLKILFHDVRNPINTITNYGEIILDDYPQLDADIRRYVQNIKDSSAQVLAIIKDLEGWLSTKNNEVTPEAFNLSRTVGSVLDLYRLGASEKGIELTHECDGQVAFADEAKVFFVLRNLLANSIKFTSSGGFVQVSVKDDRDFVQVAVSDSGMGIAPDRLEKVFDGGMNVSTMGTSGEKGTGFGLCTSKEFVEKMGGKIWIESEVGVGTTFFFTLPRGPFVPQI